MIKRTPADFQVSEILNSDLLGLAQTEGAFALYRLEKESLATPEAIGQLARELDLHAGSWAYAGLKDKHAKTTQHITLKVEADKPAPDKAHGKGWKIERLGFVPRSITAADIVRNKFHITMRNLSPQESFDLDEAVKLLTIPGGAEGKPELRIVNYFGDQRFGSARHGQGFIARHLIKEDFEGALRLAIATEARKDRMEQKKFKRALVDDWGNWSAVLPKLRRCPERKAIERLANSSGDFRAAFCALPYLLQQLSVYAYQSYLWNAIARKVIERFCVPLGAVLAADDPFGEMLFPSSASMLPELIGLEIPLLAKKTELIEPWKQAADEVLGEEGIAVTELEIPGVRRPFFGEEPRALFFTAQDFHLARATTDETATDKRRQKRSITFSLPRGCYATVLLRALNQ